MSIIEIRKAQREGARLVVGFAAPTGQGKTFSAILFGYGLANYDATKLGFLDTENRRGSLYADILQTATPPTQTPFLIGDLVAPFSPQRYMEAISEFQKAGVEVLVVDSVTHEHEGPGGLIEIADGGPEHKTPNKYWNRAKAEHKKFVNALLQSDMHIIVCVRAREKAEPTAERDDAGVMKKGYADLGMQPITEKNLMFEMTASLMMMDEGKRQQSLKMPSALRPWLGRNNDYLTPADGKAVRAWVDGANQLDRGVEKYRNRLLSVCVEGEKFIVDAWTNKTPEAVRTALGQKFYETLVASAKAYDKAKEDAQEGASAPAADSGPPADGPGAAIAAAAKAGLAAKAEEPAKSAKAEAKPEAKTDSKVTALRPATTASVVVDKPAAEATKDLPLATPAAATAAGAKRVGLVDLSDPMF